MRSCETCRYTQGSDHCRGCNYSMGLQWWEPKLITNADRIRGMTDEELTRFFAENCGCGDWCMHHRSGACANKPENECCLDVWHKWLKSPADEGGDENV